jgi:hypothetical protein
VENDEPLPGDRVQFLIETNARTGKLQACDVTRLA